MIIFQIFIILTLSCLLLYVIYNLSITIIENNYIHKLQLNIQQQVSETQKVNISENDISQENEKTNLVREGNDTPLSDFNLETLNSFSFNDDAGNIPSPVIIYFSGHGYDENSLKKIKDKKISVVVINNAFSNSKVEQKMLNMCIDILEKIKTNKKNIELIGDIK